MKSRTIKILVVLRVLAWMAMIGYAINLGSQVICLAVSMVNPEATIKIPGVGQNLFNLLHYSFKYYWYAMFFVLAYSAMLVYFWNLVISLFSKLSLSNPFTLEVSGKLEKLAYWLIAIWVVSGIGKIYIAWLSGIMKEQLNVLQDTNDLLFTAGIIYLISQIFRRGIEIQEENQQTI
jgi:hypothetical protein